MESVINGNLLTGNQSGIKKSKLFKRLDRPWDEKNTDQMVLKGDAMSLHALDDFMSSRMSS